MDELENFLCRLFATAHHEPDSTALSGGGHATTGIHHAFWPTDFLTLSRAKSLDVHEVRNGYIVYDKARNRMHYLNNTAAIIFEFCDSKLEPDDVVRRVVKAFDLGPAAHVEIRAALDLLLNEGLVLSSSM